MLSKLHNVNIHDVDTCLNIPAKDVWRFAYLKSIFGTTLGQLVFDDGIFTNLNTTML